MVRRGPMASRPAFFFRQIVDENFRTAAGTYGHFQPIYYYIPVFLENTIPWNFFFPPLALFIYKQRDKLSEQEFLFPLTWLITGFVFFSASLGKGASIFLPSTHPRRCSSALVAMARRKHRE